MLTKIITLREARENAIQHSRETDAGEAGGEEAFCVHCERMISDPRAVCPHCGLEQSDETDCDHPFRVTGDSCLNCGAQDTDVVAMAARIKMLEAQVI